MSGSDQKNEDAVKRKIEALESEILQLKKQKESTIHEKVVESTQFFIADDGVTELFKVLQKQLSTADIWVAPRNTYKDQKLWSVKCDLFGIQYQNKIITIIDDVKHPFITWSESITGKEVTITLDMYQKDPTDWPLATLISMLLDHSPKDDLFFYMPMYCAMFWGMIKTALFAHIQYQREYGNDDCLKIEDIKDTFL